MKDFRVIGTSYPRKDGPAKVHGRARYTDDYRVPGMLYAAMVTSPHAHAKILSLDTSQAERAPGVRVVVTGQDYPIRLGLYLGGSGGRG
jgi:CO/xanthine dehydrogenase Mo-binding subunit